MLLARITSRLAAVGAIGAQSLARISSSASFGYSDGWPDVFIGSDRVPAKLYRNDGKGHFVDEGVRAGVALSENGVARANMGVDAADYDRSGRPHIVVGNFVNEMLGLYHNDNGAQFHDAAPRTDVGRASLLAVTWATFFLDADLDGAVEGVVDAIWFNQGQVCCAGSRLLVQEGIAADFHRRLKRRMASLRVGHPLDKTIDMGAIVDPTQLSRISSLVDKGVAEGADKYQPDIALPGQGCFFPPTLLANVQPASTVAVEEIFGPVLAVIPFDPQMFGTAANNGQMIAEISANHRAARMFQQMARRLTGRSDPAKKDSFLAPIMKKLRRAS